MSIGFWPGDRRVDRRGLARHHEPRPCQPRRHGRIGEEIAIELGGAFGITVLASVYSALLVLPNGAVLPPAVHERVDQALMVARTLPPALAHLLTQSVHLAFGSAYFTALAINAALLAVVAIMAWRARAAPLAESRVRPMRLLPVTPP